MDPHPVIVTIRDNRDYIKVLFYSYYTTITGWGVLLKDGPSPLKVRRDMGSAMLTSVALHTTHETDHAC